MAFTRYPYPQQPSPSSDTPTEVAFLADWKRDHRDLTDEQRAAVGEYIRAIVIRSNTTTPDSDAATLWIKFRTFYDDLRGRYSKTDKEDVLRAMSKI